MCISEMNVSGEGPAPLSGDGASEADASSPEMNTNRTPFASGLKGELSMTTKINRSPADENLTEDPRLVEMRAMRKVFKELLGGVAATFRPVSFRGGNFYRRRGGDFNSTVTRDRADAILALRSLPPAHRKMVFFWTISEGSEEGGWVYGCSPGQGPKRDEHPSIEGPDLVIEISSEAGEAWEAWIASGQSETAEAVEIVLTKKRGGGDLASLRKVFEQMLPDADPDGWVYFSPGSTLNRAAACVPAGRHLAPLSADDLESGRFKISSAADKIIEAWVKSPKASPTPEDVEEVWEADRLREIRRKEEAAAEEAAEEAAYLASLPPQVPNPNYVEDDDIPF